MSTRLLKLAGVVGLLATGLLMVFTAGMRSENPVLRDRIRMFNRSVVNPRQRDAGTPGAYASLIQHSGRSTGASYTTPVVAEETEDGFVIALPYGARADWVKNVVAAGSSTIVHEGRTHHLVEPELVPIAHADAYFSPGDRRAHRIFGTTECLRLRRREPEPA